jgi:hypothetical protein
MVVSCRLQKIHLIGQNHDLVAGYTANDRWRTPRAAKKPRGYAQSQVIILFSGVWILQAMPSVMD